MSGCRSSTFSEEKVDTIHLKKKAAFLLVGCKFLLLPLISGTICLLSKSCASMLVPHTQVALVQQLDKSFVQQGNMAG